MAEEVPAVFIPPPVVHPAIDELLTHLEEEAAEIVQACTKLRRFGLEEKDPRLNPAEAPTNRKALAMEFGQLVCVVDCLSALESSLFLNDNVKAGWDRKFGRLQKYLRHSTIATEDGELSVRVLRASGGTP
jgi:NTP pyrophosphatase (non-canonical NTP hydrolase)